MEVADNIALKTYKGGTVSPLDDAIIQQTVISTNGIFKGCNITNPRGNVLQISSGFGMIKGRFFEVYNCEIGVVLNSETGTLEGRLYIHMDLSNTDEPIQILTETAKTLTDLDGDEDVNYNNTFYNMELARFGVTQTGITDLASTFQKIIGASGSGGGSTLKRAESYEKGDFAYCDSTLGWITLYCTTAGKTAETEPAEYGGIEKIGDTVQDGTCVFTARDVIGELDLLKDIQENNPNVPVGIIRFMSSSHVDDTWLRCDGSYINEKNYPELVAALGKSLPEGEKFTILSNGEIPPQISNGVVYNNRMWVYSYSARKLYGVDLEKSTPIKTISFTSTSQQF